MMSTSSRGRRRARRPSAAAGSAAQEMTQASEHPLTDSTSDSGQPQLVEEVTQRVLQALAEVNQKGKKRSQGRQGANSKKKRQRTPSTSGTDSNSGSESESGSSSASSDSDSDDDFELLSSPIACQIDLKLKNKIWQNKYIDFVKLLPKEDFTSEKSVRLQSAGNSEYKFVAAKPKKSIKSVEQWTTAFLKFLAVYSEKFPKQIPAVIKHGEIVRELANRCNGSSWLTYDKQVRKDIEVRSIPWGQLLYEYWVMATTFRQPPTQFNFRGKSVQSKVSYRGKVPQGFCYAFHRNGRCSTQQCQYKHTCFQCRKQHSVLYCAWGDKTNNKSNSTSQQSKQSAAPSSTSK
ncbi:uncharacterized protein LOC144617448 isoform X1 [Crassostrea virginica]